MDEKLENQTPENETESNIYRDPNEGAVYKEIKTEEPKEQSAASYTYGEPGPKQENEQSEAGRGYTNPQNNQYNGQYNNQYNNQYGNQYNAYNNAYNNANYQAPEMDNSPLSMGEWLLTLLVAMIPCAGLILYIVWAFSKSGNLNRRNFCRAYLIVEVIAFVLIFIFIIFMAVAAGIGMSGYYY